MTDNMSQNTVKDRVLNDALRGKCMDAGEAAKLIHDGFTVGMSGFTAVGYALSK